MGDEQMASKTQETHWNKTLMKWWFDFTQNYSNISMAKIETYYQQRKSSRINNVWEYFVLISAQPLL